MPTSFLVSALELSMFVSTSAIVVPVVLGLCIKMSSVEFDLQNKKMPQNSLKTC